MILEKDRVLLEDEALRDGLQQEIRILSLDEKLNLFQLLRRAGVKRIQVGSFVSPKAVPQLADTEALIKAIGEQEKSLISALVLNEKGLERALNCGIGHLSMSVSASDTHSRKNTQKPAAEALEIMTKLIGHALASGLKVRAGIQCAFGCVYEGHIDEDLVLRVAEKMIQAGALEINLADTTGMATPKLIRSLISKIDREFPTTRVSLHLHDTRGLGLLNMLSGYEAGVRYFDVCAGGIGGCPFVKGAAGNVPTEDAVHMFEAMGVHTEIDIRSICVAVDYLEKKFGRQLPGRMKSVLNAGGAIG
jgi:hydroxymethylglutaryl-CoA lyase